MRKIFLNVIGLSQYTVSEDFNSGRFTFMRFSCKPLEVNAPRPRGATSGGVPSGGGSHLR